MKVLKNYQLRWNYNSIMYILLKGNMAAKQRTVSADYQCSRAHMLD